MICIFEVYSSWHIQGFAFNYDKELGKNKQKKRVMFSLYGAIG